MSEYKYAEGYGLDGLAASVNKYVAEGYVPDGDVQELESSAVVSYKRRYMQRLVKDERIKVVGDWDFHVIDESSIETLNAEVHKWSELGFVPQGGISHTVVDAENAYVEWYSLLMVKGL
jgi:hypothetical protein